MKKHRKNYTRFEEIYIEENYEVLTNAQIAKELGRTEESVTEKCLRLRLHEKKHDKFMHAIDFCKEKGFKNISEAITHYGDVYLFKQAYQRVEE